MLDSFVWNMVTLLVSRMLLRLRALDRDTVALPALKALPTRMDSPRARATGSFQLHEDWEMKSTGSTPGEVEVGKVELVVVHR
jgi:hypothetical protein